MRNAWRFSWYVSNAAGGGGTGNGATLKKPDIARHYHAVKKRNGVDGSKLRVRSQWQKLNAHVLHTSQEGGVKGQTSKKNIVTYPRG